MAAATPDARVVDALMARLSTLVLAPPLPVAWPGIDFVKPASGYLEPSWLPAGTLQFAVSNAGSKQYSGILQVSVFLPEDRGLVGPVDVAGAVAAHFAKGTVAERPGVGVRVRIENPPQVEAPLQEPGWVQVPVSVPYQASV